MPARTDAERIARLEALLLAAGAALFPYVWAPHWLVSGPAPAEAEPLEGLGMPDEAADYHLQVTEADMVRAQEVYERLVNEIRGDP